MVPSAYFLSLHIYHSLWCQNRSPEGAAASSCSCQLSPYPGQGHRAVPQDQLCCEVHEPLPTLLLPLTQQVSLGDASNYSRVVWRAVLVTNSQVVFWFAWNLAKCFGEFETCKQFQKT